MRVLGVNAIYHDPAAALVVDGEVVAAAEEERFSRRKHGRRPVPFAAWELPELAAQWCLRAAGLTAPHRESAVLVAGRAARPAALARYGLGRFLDDRDRRLKEVTR